MFFYVHQSHEFETLRAFACHNFFKNLHKLRLIEKENVKISISLLFNINRTKLSVIRTEEFKNFARFPGDEVASLILLSLCGMRAMFVTILTFVHFRV